MHDQSTNQMEIKQKALFLHVTGSFFDNLVRSQTSMSMDKVKISRLLKKKGYHIYIQRQSQKQRKIGITTDQTENSKNLSIPESGIRQDKIRNYSGFGPVARKILEADARHGILVFLYSSQLRNYLYTQFQNPPARQIVEFHRNSLGEL